jgi:YVTN family beta-propeller protein
LTLTSASTNESGNSVSVIDTDPTSATYNTVIATVPVGSYPWGVAVSPNGTNILGSSSAL